MGFRSPAAEAEFMAVYDAALAAWPVPYTELEVPTHFGATHVMVCGPEAAPPLVLIHAAGTSSLIWRRNIAALSERYRTYLIDIVDEANKSRCEAAMTSRSDSVDWVGEVLGGLKLGQVHLGGLSRGGWLALNFALAMPDRVKSLALLAPAASLAKFRLAFFINFLGPAILRSRRLVYRTFRWLSVQGERFDKYVPELMFLAVKHFQYPKGGIYPSVFSDDELRRLAAPCLLLIGDQERIYDPKLAMERGRQLIPNLRSAWIPGAGHLALMEKPELVNEHLLKFLGDVQ